MNGKCEFLWLVEWHSDTNGTKNKNAFKYASHFSHAIVQMVLKGIFSMKSENGEIKSHGK